MIRCRMALIAFFVSPLFGFSADPLHQTIDAHLQSAWAKEKISPARPSSDSEFLRRAYLDLVGQIPTYEETVAFLDRTDATKRSVLIDKLLADPRYASHQADVWDLILFGRNPPGYDTDKREGFQAWLVSQFERNVPYDVLARTILKAEGNSLEGGALYYAQYRNAPEDAIQSITQTFLGVQLQCARCHNHPYESWKQKEFFGMAAFLARLEVVSVGKKGNRTLYAIGEKNSGDVRFTGPARDAKPGDKGEAVRPKFLLGNELEEPPLPKGFKEVKFAANKPPPKPKFSRKDALAEWITKADNPFFAKAIANRIWGQFMGRGIFHPVDNLSKSDEAKLPELLDVIARELVSHKFDLKWLIREIVSSKAYQLASAGSGEAMPEWYQHARSRPLSAEELSDSWRVAMGTPAETESKENGKTDRFRKLGREYMMRYFGSPNTGAGDFQGGMHEHLYLNNGPLSGLIGVKGGLAAELSDTKIPVDKRIERLYLSTLSRRPSDVERKRFAEFLNGKGSPSDAVWALITSSEFRFNH